MESYSASISIPLQTTLALLGSRSTGRKWKVEACNWQTHRVCKEHFPKGKEKSGRCPLPFSHYSPQSQGHARPSLIPWSVPYHFLPSPSSRHPSWALDTRSWTTQIMLHLFLHIPGPLCLLFLLLSVFLLRCGQLLSRTFSDPPGQIEYLPTAIGASLSLCMVVKILDEVTFVSRLDLRWLRVGIHSYPTDLWRSKCVCLIETVRSPHSHPFFLATEPWLGVLCTQLNADFLSLPCS